MVKSVLTVEHIHHAAFDRLDNHHATIEARLLIHVPYDPIHERPEEVAFPKLYDPFGITLIGNIVPVQRSHDSLT